MSHFLWFTVYTHAHAFHTLNSYRQQQADKVTNSARYTFSIQTATDQ